MNYYKRHLGDYAKDTRHLSLAEHGAFCLLLDYYYATEKPIQDDRCERIANAYADSERKAVRAVLSEFFTLTDDGWRNSRADEEIEAANAKSLKAKESAEKRWSERNANAYANASETHSEGNASHKPLANSHKKEQKKRATPSKGRKSQDLTLPDWIESLGDEPAVTADDPIFRWASDTGLPSDWIALAWWMFETRYSDNGKTYADWRAVFRKAVREDWLKVWQWRERENAFVLTTAAQLALKEMEAAR